MAIKEKFPHELSEEKLPQELIEEKLPQELSEEKLPQELIEEKLPQELSEEKLPQELSEEELPQELIEEILLRVEPKTLGGCKIVSKKWNALLQDKTFIKNHKATFRFLLTTKSKIFSVSFDPKIHVCELTLDTPDSDQFRIPKKVVDCNEYSLCEMESGALLWNPWFPQSRWIQPNLKQTQMQIHAVAPDNKGSYKIIVSGNEMATSVFSVHDIASDALLKDHEVESHRTQGMKSVFIHNSEGVVSLNGNLYYISYHDKTDLVYHITTLNFSRDGFIRFCNLPCGTTDLLMDALVLKTFEGDRFSLLKQCHATKKIETWVSKNKIYNNGYSENVEWIKIIEVSSPDLPDLVDKFYSQPSYFIEDKRLVVCSCDKVGRAWIYVFCEDKFITKTRLASVVDLWPSHCTFIPSLVWVPRV